MGSETAMARYLIATLLGLLVAVLFASAKANLIGNLWLTFRLMPVRVSGHLVTYDPKAPQPKPKPNIPPAPELDLTAKSLMVHGIFLEDAANMAPLMMIAFGFGLYIWDGRKAARAGKPLFLANEI
jgi:hypothetical protein